MLLSNSARWLPVARRVYLQAIGLLDFLRDGVFLLLRLYFGWHLWISGWNKLRNLAETADFFRGLQIPLPELNVYMAGGTEMIGGMLLLLGLAARPAAIPVMGTMLVAYMTAHSDQFAAFFSNTPVFFKAPPFPYLFTVAMVLLCGPGRLSLDALIGYLVSRHLEAPMAPADRPMMSSTSATSVAST